MTTDRRTDDIPSVTTSRSGLDWLAFVRVATSVTVSEASATRRFAGLGRRSEHRDFGSEVTIPSRHSRTKIVRRLQTAL